jgi:hypothetical protein
LVGGAASNHWSFGNVFFALVIGFMFDYFFSLSSADVGLIFITHAITTHYVFKVKLL